MRELRPATSDVGGERDLHAAAEHPALQPGNNGLAHVADYRGVFDAIAEFPEPRQVGERVEVAAGGERLLAGAGDGGDPDVVIVVDLAADPLQLPRHVAGMGALCFSGRTMRCGRHRRQC